MKKILCVFSVLFMLGMLQAAPRYLLGIPVPAAGADGEQTQLRSYVRDLATKGLDVYYYNETQVIAGSEGLYPGSRLLQENPGDGLYLVGKRGSSTEVQLNRLGKVLLDLGSSWLLASDLDDIGLRAKINNPFTPLHLAPMQLSGNTLSNELARETRTEIENLVSSVSADSITAFLTRMQNFQTRYALAENRLTVANWIKGQFQRFGITNAELYPFQWQGTTQYDVVATIPGTISPDTYILVGGHHDSITNNTPLTSAPGADDNATGTVATIEMARVMMANNYHPRCSIRFVTFAAEEFGLWGSKAYAQMADDANMDIRLMINHDMLANTSPNPTDLRVLLMPYDGYTEYTDYAAGITAQYTDLIPVNGSFNSGSSDSYPFWQHGFPVVYYFEYNFSQVYHSDNDTMAHLDPAYCAKVIKASTAVAASFANMPSTPSALTVRDMGTGTSLRVDWQATTDPFVTGYRVYYQAEGATDPQMLTTSNTNIVIGELTHDVTYDISVCAIDANNMESTRIYGTGTPRLNPLTPGNFHDQPELGVIRLTWDANQEMDFLCYKIYRSTNPDDLGSLITTTTETTYVDHNVSGSQAYYHYSICAEDISGFPSPFATVDSRPVSLNCGILVVDETKNYSGTNPFQPTDAMVDDYYDNLLSGYNVTEHLDLDTHTSLLRLADLGVYSTILWHGNDTADENYPYLVRDVLEQYLSMGGKMLFSLYQPSAAFELNATYPAVFNETRYIRRVLGIQGVDLSNAARFRYAWTPSTLYPQLTVDSLKTTTALNGHIIKVEALSPVANSETLYTYGSDYAADTPQGEFNGEPVGILYNCGGGEVATLSFPLYSMKPVPARQFVQYLFSQVFLEPSANDDEHADQVPGLQILPSYPNPFSESCTVGIKTSDPHHSMKVEVYNLKGQKVRMLFEGAPTTRSGIMWDGRDDKGLPSASGIYFVKVSQNGASGIRKLMLIK